MYLEAVEECASDILIWFGMEVLGGAHLTDKSWLHLMDWNIIALGFAKAGDYDLSTAYKMEAMR